MGVTTFKGGVHPYDGKELAMDKSIVDLRPEGFIHFRSTLEPLPSPWYKREIGFF